VRQDGTLIDKDRTCIAQAEGGGKEMSVGTAAHTPLHSPHQRCAFVTPGRCLPRSVLQLRLGRVCATFGLPVVPDV